MYFQSTMHARVGMSTRCDYSQMLTTDARTRQRERTLRRLKITGIEAFRACAHATRGALGSTTPTRQQSNLLCAYYNHLLRKQDDPSLGREHDHGCKR